MYGQPIVGLGHLFHALVPLLLLGLLVRLTRRGTDPSAPWSTPVDFGLALASGVTATALSGAWLVDYHLLEFPLSASDFGQYCESVAAFRSGDLDGWAIQRSLVPGALPGWMSGPLGIIDGLLLSALLSHALMGAGLYLWGRAAHGRLAGAVAALLGCAVGPLVMLTRTVTFYPEACAAYVLSAAAATLALRYRNLPAVTASAVTCALVFNVDVRGLLWALPALGLTLAAALAVRGWWRKAVALLLIGAFLAGSYRVGGATTWARSPTLEQQTTFYVDEAIRRFSTDGDTPSDLNQRVFEDPYLWGRSPPQAIPHTLGQLLDIQRRLPEGLADHPETRTIRGQQIEPWLLPAGVALVLAVWGLRRRPLLAAGLLGSLAPFAVALHGTATVHAHVRYMGNGMAIVPLLLALGVAVVAQGSLGAEDRPRGERWWSWTDGALLGALLLLLLGIVPSWLSPVATWRMPSGAEREPHASLEAALHRSSRAPGLSAPCLKALRQDVRDGLPPGSRLLDWRIDGGE